MERKIARFNERIVIQKNEVVTDKYGNHKNTWIDFTIIRKSTSIN